MSNDDNITFSIEESQNARCLLRERYLRATAGLVGKKCTFLMHGGTTLSGIYRGADSTFSNILVDDLTTPPPAPKHSILRSTDILTMSFELESPTAKFNTEFIVDTCEDVKVKCTPVPE